MGHVGVYSLLAQREYIMKQRSIFCISIIGLLILFLIASCGKKDSPESVTQPETDVPADAPMEPPTSAPTVAPTSTPIPSPTSTSEPSPTPLPADTPTPLPTPTPEITAGEYFEQGLALFEEENLETAMAAFDRAISLDPWLQTEAFFYHHVARQGLEENQALVDIDAEIAELDQTLAGDAENAEAFYRRGKAKYTRTLLSGEPIERRPLFEDNENVNVVGGTITADTLILAQAIADFDEAISLNPEFAAAYHMRGLSYHLQGLEYIGIGLVDFYPEDIEQAIDDYDQAISLDPDLNVAYRDRGAAVALQVWVSGKESGLDMASIKAMDKAILDFDLAIEGDPGSIDLYLNRSYAQMVLTRELVNAGEEFIDVAQSLFNDATRVIALDPENLWGYLFRLMAFNLVGDSSEYLDLAGEWEPVIDENMEILESLFEELAIQYEISDIFTRVLTLSEGPPIIPLSSESKSFGQFSGGRYTSPDGFVEFEIPDLMQPNAVIWDELTAAGNLLVWFEDDIARSFSMQVHPGELGDMPLIDWVAENINQYLDLQEVYEINNQIGSVVMTEYRYGDPEGSCAYAILHYEEYFYGAEYCLFDQYMGEEDEFGGIRLFAAGYGIEYEPVDQVLLDFLQGVDVHGQPFLSPASAVIENGSSEISINVDTVDLQVCGDNLAGNVVYVQMWRDSVENNNPRTWNYVDIATDNCLELTDLDGDDPTFTGAIYYTVAAIEPLAGDEAAEQQTECYDTREKTRLCDAIGR